MRLDVYLYQNGFAQSRQAAKNLITAGSVSVDGNIQTKPSYEIETGDVKIIGDVCPYVSRGAYKLLGALEHFELDVTGMTALDIGASTGGFTDLLLSRGAKRVYAVDSGIGQLHSKLESDERVISIEKYNARNLNADDIGEKCDIVVMDVSFISQTYIIPNIPSVLKENGVFIGLIKPQFEAGRAHIGKGGIVKNLDVHASVCERIIAFAREHRLMCFGLTRSPIEGGDGNREYLAAFRYGGEVKNIDVKKTVYSK